VQDCVVGLVGAPPSSDIKGLPAQTPLKADIGRKGHLPAVTNTWPPARAFDRMPVIAPRVLRAILIGPSNEKTGRGRKLPERSRP
jgi:hypothetical protein